MLVLGVPQNISTANQIHSRLLVRSIFPLVFDFLQMRGLMVVDSIDIRLGGNTL
jgi:hypothetical protein